MEATDGGRGCRTHEAFVDHICLAYPRMTAMAIILATSNLSSDDERRLYISEILGNLFSIPSAP